MDWKQILGQIAPVLGGALGGPVGAAAVKILADKLLGNPSASEAEVIEALSSGSLSGEQILALKQAEQMFLLELERLDVEREKAGLVDTQNARGQTIDLAKIGSGMAWGAPVVSTLIIMGYFFCIYRLFIIEQDMPDAAFQLLTVMFGALSIAFGQVCNYWLGSSAGSKRSGDALRSISAKASVKAE